MPETWMLRLLSQPFIQIGVGLGIGSLGFLWFLGHYFVDDLENDEPSDDDEIETKIEYHKKELKLLEAEQDYRSSNENALDEMRQILDEMRSIQKSYQADS